MPNKSGFVDFNPDNDLPPLTSKVIFITGGTAGLGAASVHALAKHDPEHIYFSGRNAQAANALIAEVKKTTTTASLTFIEIDLSSLSSVKAASQKFHHDRLDILMCNAGISENPPALSEDGYEIHFATNHLGHAMLIRQMLPTLLNTARLTDADVRIVILSSRAWWVHNKGGIIFSKLTTKQDGWHEGVLNQVWAVAGVKKEGLVNGGYYEPVGVLCDHKLNKTAKDEGLAKRLWEWTEEALDKIK
ncbi:hypothetical protein DL95DRAFT_283656 [Leptodontidium sp. 2 PMI_412]|nr:hypothetical protein DL95DRAFT_283656 [Leptodontidium sp. 2 PMI_412]